MADVTYTVDSLDDLSETFEFIREKTAQVALEEIEKAAQQNPAMQNAVVIVDGRKDRALTDVKLWGTITIVAPDGPVQEAVHLAYEYVVSRCGAFQNPSGFYASNFMWFVNGDPVSQQAPDVSRMGLRGNVQLVNRAGYASMPEIFIPHGIIYGAYNMLRQIFGDRLALSYSYGPPHAFSQVWPANRTSKPFLAVPVLTIGHPSAAFKRRATKPGVRLRKRARDARKKAA